MLDKKIDFDEMYDIDDIRYRKLMGRQMIAICMITMLDLKLGIISEKLGVKKEDFPDECAMIDDEYKHLKELIYAFKNLEKIEEETIEKMKKIKEDPCSAFADLLFGINNKKDSDDSDKGGQHEVL